MCDRVTGVCPDGCDPRWTGPKCNSKGGLKPSWGVNEKLIVHIKIERFYFIRYFLFKYIRTD